MTTFAGIRIFLCMTPTKMSYSFDGLMGRAQAIFDQDPSSGHLFLFLNRDRDRVKILFWDHDFAFGTNGLRPALFNSPTLRTTSRASNWTSAN